MILATPRRLLRLFLCVRNEGRKAPVGNNAREPRNHTKIQRNDSLRVEEEIWLNQEGSILENAAAPSRLSLGVCGRFL